MGQYRRILILRIVLAMLGLLLAAESFFLRPNFRLGAPAIAFPVFTDSGISNQNSAPDYSSNQSWSNSSDSGSGGWDSGGDSGWDNGGGGWDSGGDSGSWDSSGGDTEGGDSGSW